MNEPTILAVDCASVPPTVALCRGAETAFRARHESAARADAWLATALDDCFSGTAIGLDDIDGLAVTVGPGTFTGIRVGIATCLGLAAPRSLPVCGVQTLEALAELGRDRGETVACCIDARRGQVYGALYRLDDAPTLPIAADWGPAVCAPEDFAAAVAAAHEPVVLGTGAELLAPSGAFRAVDLDEELAVAAARLAARSWAAAAEGASNWPPPEPFYLRPPDAREPKNPLLEGR